MLLKKNCHPYHLVTRDIRVSFVIAKSRYIGFVFFFICRLILPITIASESFPYKFLMVVWNWWSKNLTRHMYMYSPEEAQGAWNVKGVRLTVNSPVINWPKLLQAIIFHFTSMYSQKKTVLRFSCFNSYFFPWHAFPPAEKP